MAPALARRRGAEGEQGGSALAKPTGGDAKLADNLTAILGDLIALPSDFPPGDTRKIGAYAAGRLKGAGYAVETLTQVEPFANVVARLGRGRPSVVFNAHADTIGPGKPGDWRSDPFKAEVRSSRVIGLGAANCKGAMAVQLWLAEEIARRGGPRTGEVVFTFVGDEEGLGPNGMSYLREAGKVNPDILILGATTDNQLITAERGVMWVRITSEGRAAHAGDPTAGDNAILRMMRLLGALERDLVPRLAARRDGEMVATLNVGIIAGGHNTNVVPSRCVVEIDRRMLPSETVAAAFAEIRATVEAAGEPKGSFAVELTRGTKGFKAPADGRAVSAFCRAIEARTGRPAAFLNAVGASDGRYFAEDGIEIINVGPGSGAEGHAANESVEIAKLVDAARIHLAVVDSLLGLAG